VVDGLFGERERIIIDKDESRYPRYIAAGLKSFRSEKKKKQVDGVKFFDNDEKSQMHIKNFISVFSKIN
jgi:hypothetical protein